MVGKIMVAAWLLAACAKDNTWAIQNSKETQRTTVNGFVEEKTNERARVDLTVWDEHDLVEGHYTLSTTTKKGYFHFPLNITKRSIFSLKIDDQPVTLNTLGFGMLIEPGDSLYMQVPTIEDCKMSDIIFSGHGAEKQHFIQEIGRETTVPPCTKNPMHQNFDERFDCYLVLEGVVNRVVDKYKNQIPAKVLNMMKAFVMASFYDRLTYYYLHHEFSGDEIRKTIQEKFDPHFPLSTLTAQDEIADANLFLVYRAQAALQYLAANNLGSENVNLSKSKTYELLKETDVSEPIREWLLANFISRYGKYVDWDEEIDSLAVDFLDTYGEESFYGRQIEILRDSFLTTLREGAPAYNFALQDTAGNIVMLQDLRGKVVVIDFMFYGCGGCALMVPALTEVEERFKNDNVLFVTISVDKTLDKVKKGRGKFSTLHTTLLYTNGEGLHHPVIQFYKVGSFPTLMVIDKEGKILDTRAPDPRTEKGKNDLCNLITGTL